MLIYSGNNVKFCSIDKFILFRITLGLLISSDFFNYPDKTPISRTLNENLDIRI